MSRSATPWRSPSGARMFSTSSQFFQLARCSSLQNFERALSDGQSDEGFLEAARLPVGGAARQILRNVEPELPLVGKRLNRADVQRARRRNLVLRPAPACSPPAPSFPSRIFAGRELASA